MTRADAIKAGRNMKVFNFEYRYAVQFKLKPSKHKGHIITEIREWGEPIHQDKDAI